MNTNFAINAMPKQAVADISGTPYFDQLFVIQNLDGTVIGTMVVIGLQITNPAPATSGLGGWGIVVVGGSGAFLGVTGQGCGISGGGTPPGGARITSVTEDPANRRINGGGSYVFRAVSDSQDSAGSCNDCRRAGDSSLERLVSGHTGQASKARRNPHVIRLRTWPHASRVWTRPALHCRSRQQLVIRQSKYS